MMYRKITLKNIFNGIHLQYSVSYDFLRLKEMEIQNICHLADLFSIEVIAANKNAPAWKKCVAPFQYDVKHGEQDN